MDPVLPGQTSLGGYALGPSFGTLIGIGLWRVIIPVLAVVLTISPAAYAHRPIIAGSRAPDPESAPRISDPSVSRVLYFELTDQSPVQWLVIENDRPREIPVLLGVPVGKDVGVSNPVLTLFGEGLDDGRDTPQMIEPPRGASTGSLTLSRTGDPRDFYEPITGTESLILVDTQLRLPVTGTYFGAVTDAGGGGGKVWVGIGRREGFTWRDVGRLPGWIRDVRRFHQVPGLPRWAWVATIAVATVVAAGGWWMIRSR